MLKQKKSVIKKDLEEMEKNICPQYEELALELSTEKSTLNVAYENITMAVKRQREELEKKVAFISDKHISEVSEMKKKHLDLLDEQDNEVSENLSEVKECIHGIRKVLDSNDVSLVTMYKSRNAEFSSLPSKVKVSLPIFSPQQINIENYFGSLSPLSIIREESSIMMRKKQSTIPLHAKSLLEKPEFESINIGYGVYSVACLNDEEIWTRGDDKVMKLYNLQGMLLKSIGTKSGNIPIDIAVTKRGTLVYTDPGTKSVKEVMDKKIHVVIRLQGWTPAFICRTLSDALLFTMDSNDGEQSKVVRFSGRSVTQTIQFDDNGKRLYSSHYLKFIAENRNGDICVSDNEAKAVVVVNNAGKLRFKYTGNLSSKKCLFDPVGISTDSQHRILLSDASNLCIDILEQDGTFLCYIDNCDLRLPWGLCMDSKDHIFVADFYSSKVKKIKYM